MVELLREQYETQPVRGATLEEVDQDLVREYARLRGLAQPQNASCAASTCSPRTR